MSCLDDRFVGETVRVIDFERLASSIAHLCFFTAGKREQLPKCFLSGRVLWVLLAERAERLLAIVGIAMGEETIGHV